jgi:hydroxymethylbilane synthase
MNTERNIILGSRGSKLALWQSEHIKARLEALHPGVKFSLEIIKTTGDKILDVPLAKIGDKGLFTKEIEQALVDRRIDLAVHSLKDLPTRIEPGLALGAVTEREDVRDAWIGKRGIAFADLPPGAPIATSSLRRRSQLWKLRPDLVIEDMRGNLDTRLRKLRESERLQGIVLACAGLRRMGWSAEITHRFTPDQMLPAVGQGALGIEIRVDDELVKSLVAPLAHEDTWISTRAERSLLTRLEGGCQIPIGAYARVEDGKLALEGLVASLDGKTQLRDRVVGDVRTPEMLGLVLAEKLLAAGADKILEQITASSRA